MNPNTKYAEIQDHNQKQNDKRYVPKKALIDISAPHQFPKLLYVSLSHKDDLKLNLDYVPFQGYQSLPI